MFASPVDRRRARLPRRRRGPPGRARPRRRHDALDVPDRGVAPLDAGGRGRQGLRRRRRQRRLPRARRGDGRAGLELLDRRPAHLRGADRRRRHRLLRHRLGRGERRLGVRPRRRDRRAPLEDLRRRRDLLRAGGRRRPRVRGQLRRAAPRRARRRDRARSCGRSAARTTASRRCRPTPTAGSTSRRTTSTPASGSVLALDAATGELVWEATGHGDGAGQRARSRSRRLVIAGSSANNWVAAYDRGHGRAPVGGSDRRGRQQQPARRRRRPRRRLAAGPPRLGARRLQRRAALGGHARATTCSRRRRSRTAASSSPTAAASSARTRRRASSPARSPTRPARRSTPRCACRRHGRRRRDRRARAASSCRHRPGTYTVEARAYGYVSRARRAHDPQRPDGRARLRARRRPRRGSLRGDRARRGRGAARGRSASSSRGTPVDPATTGADGAFAFAGVAAGTYELVATLNGYVRSSTEVTVAAGEETTADVTLLRYEIAVTGDHGGAITRCLEGRGYRVESTTIAAIADRPGDYGLIVANGSQDDPGNETIRRARRERRRRRDERPLPRHLGHLATAPSCHLSRATGDPAQTGSGSNDGEVSLVARVAHPLTDGLPLGERVPALAPRTPSTPCVRRLLRAVRSPTSTSASKAATVGSGLGYQARSVGSVHVLLSLHAASPWSGPTLSWTPAGGQGLRERRRLCARRELRRGRRERSPTQGGSPLAAKVTVAETGEATTAGPDGRYRLLLPPGSYTLRFERIGFTTQELPVTVAERATTTLDAQLAVERAGGITGLVTSAADGSPVAGAEVTVLDSGLPPATTGADGALLARRRAGRHVPRPGAAPSASRPQSSRTSSSWTAPPRSSPSSSSPSPRVAVHRRRRHEDHRLPALTRDRGDRDRLGGDRLALELRPRSIVHDPTDPGEAPFRGRLAALDAAGKSAIFIEGALSSRRRQPPAAASTSASRPRATSSPPTAIRYFDAVAPGTRCSPASLATASRCSPATSGAATSPATPGSSWPTSAPASSAPSGSGGLRAADAVQRAAPAVGALGSSVLARPDAGWTEDGRRLFLNAVRWAAAPGLGAAAGRVTDAGRGADRSAHVAPRRDRRRPRSRARSGDYVLPHAPGDYTIEVSAFGYRTEQLPVTIEANRTIELNVELALADVGSVAGVVTSRPGPLADGGARRAARGRGGAPRRLPAQRDHGGGRLLPARERRAGHIHARDPRRRPRPRAREGVVVAVGRGDARRRAACGRHRRSA